MTPNIDGLSTFLICTGAIAVTSLAMAWYEKNKKIRDELKIRAKVLSSTDAAWKKVGKVSELFCYPLKSGKATAIKECFFGEFGATIGGAIRSIEDRMFAVFDEENRKSVSARSHPKLITVRLSFVAENRAKLEADGNPPLEFDLPDLKSEPVNFLMWYGENVNGIDCGSEPSRWFSKFLNNSDSGLRLAMRTPAKRHRPVTTGAYKFYTKVFAKMRDEDTGLYSDLASYMVLSKESVDDLNKRMEKPIPPVQLRPNVVVEGCEPYAEDNWNEWIKIGNRAIIRRFKLCPRCTMTRVDPDTGIPDPKYEALKTLRTYRKLKDPLLDKLEDHAPTMGVYCGLYRPGMVHLNDDVYVYQD